MDPAANDRKEPRYLRAWKGVAFALIVLVLLAILGSYMLKPVPGAENVMSEPQAPGNSLDQAAPIAVPDNTIEIRGVETCLPHKNTTGPQTTECAIGLKADDGYTYALDTGSLQPDAIGEMAGGNRVRIVGHFVPAEALSSDQWQKYDFRGVVQVTVIERIAQ